MPTLLSKAVVRDAISRLHGWAGDTGGITRTITLTASEHNDFLERIKVCSDAMNHRPAIRRGGDQTRVWLCTADEGGITECDIALAARINAIVRIVAGPADPQP